MDSQQGFPGDGECPDWVQSGLVATGAAQVPSLWQRRPAWHSTEVVQGPPAALSGQEPPVVPLAPPLEVPPVPLDCGAHCWLALQTSGEQQVRPPAQESPACLQRFPVVFPAVAVEPLVPTPPVVLLVPLLLLLHATLRATA